MREKADVGVVTPPGAKAPLLVLPQRCCSSQNRRIPIYLCAHLVYSASFVKEMEGLSARGAAAAAVGGQEVKRERRRSGFSSA